MRKTAALFRVSPNTVHVLKKLFIETCHWLRSPVMAVVCGASLLRANFTCRPCFVRRWSSRWRNSAGATLIPMA
ncbi:protein of unknown function [Methylocaldum szegediense]|uniref:Transposase n=1 Tax=Methylocaldum szegediense TaxID=73780 RepID=A0ABN8X7Y5_9GAMM|nr:protein of unknown function [Methylocaldum szegediense]